MRWHVLMRFWNCFCLFPWSLLDSTFQVRWGIHFCWTFQHPRERFILFCENPQTKFPILRHVHLHSRRNSSWHNLKDKVSWTLIVHSCLLLCLKALLGDGLWRVCLDSHLQRYYIEEDYWLGRGLAWMRRKSSTFDACQLEKLAVCVSLLRLAGWDTPSIRWFVGLLGLTNHSGQTLFRNLPTGFNGCNGHMINSPFSCL